MVAWSASAAYGITPTAYQNIGQSLKSATEATDGDENDLTVSYYGAGVHTGTYYRGWELDLGSAQHFDGVTVMHNPNAGSGTLGGRPTVLAYSPDGSAWTTIVGAFVAGAGGWDGTGLPGDPIPYTWTPGAAVQARYLRVYQTLTPTGYHSGVNVVEILVDAGVEPVIPVDPEPTLTIGSVVLERPLEIRCRVELNAAGAGYFRIAKSDAQATEAILARGAICKVAFPEIDPDPIFEFFLQEGDFELIGRPEGSEVLSFSGPGTLSYLARAVMDLEEYEGGAGQVQLSKGRWRFDENGTEGKIVEKMLREAQSASRPSDPIPALTWTFDDTEDSAGEPWANVEIEGYWFEKIGTNLLTAVLRLVRAGLCSIEMGPGLVLNMYRDIGADLTGTSFGTGVVRFVKGVNIAAELSRSMAGISFASHGVVRYGDGSYTRATKDGGTPYDQEAYFESNAEKAVTARRQAKNHMKLREDAQEALILSHRVPWPGDGNDEASGIYLPGPAWSDNGRYWVGDLVTLHTGTGEFDYDNATKRVYAITLAVDATGHLAPPIVELNARYQKTRASEELGTITGGSGSVTIVGGGPATADEPVVPYWKQPVRCVVTTDVTISTALNAGDSAGGCTLVGGDRVLLVGQSDAEDNGIWVAGATPSRGTDFDAGDEVVGAIVYVREGTGAGALYVCTNTSEPVIDTDDLTFQELELGGADTTLNTVASSGSTETLDVSTARTHDETLTADCTFTFSGAVTSEAWWFTLVLRQDGTGGWDATWPGSVVWPGGSAPTLDTTASTLEVLTFFSFDGGTTWYGFTKEGGGEPTADAHIADTTDAHDASAISIADAGNYYTGSTVEAALQEIGAGGIGGGGGGHYEVIVSGSAPPVAVTNEAEDDWLYGWVED